ncbi:tandem-95 repeat protein [Pseudomonas aeruginosa]|uniref:tandem-95 repeat protein n=1 Tax=Pseudomonas aeruginosa TaxID=287 RepID=UPI002B273E5D|nr:tandem-95 repeat protein [Pseudomonas aeruginosa]MEA8592972.1 tandem-95 repeat protein [Pseudomonas aeruginosa]
MFTPAANWNDTTSLTYRAQDSSGAWSPPAVLTITVRAVNDPPTVVNRVPRLMEDSQAVLLLSAIDVDSSAFNYEVVAHPVLGSFSISGAQFSYTPSQDWSGDTSLTYRSKDDAGAWSNVATVNIAVSSVNDPPVATPLSLVIDENARGVVTLLATDIDSAQTFEYELVGLPGGTVDISIEGDQLAVKPSHNRSGSLSVGYRAKDQGGEWSSTTLVAVTVHPVNDAPVMYLPMMIKACEAESVSVKGRVQ